MASVIILGVLYLAFIACIAYTVSLLRSFVLTKKYSKGYVKVEAQHYIPFPAVQIRKQLKYFLENKEESEKKQYTLLFDKLEEFYQAKYFSLEKELQDDFTHFDPAEKVDSPIDKMKREVIEDRFLKNWLKMLEKANFKPLTQSEYDFAVQEDYSSTLPAEVDWSTLDNTTLGRYLVYLNRSQTKELPSFSDRAWVYHRGVGVDQTEDLLIMEKLDVMIIAFLSWIYNLGLILTGNSLKAEGEEEKEQTNAQVIQRITLRSSLKKGKSLFQTTRLQEPTFKQLVILYVQPYKDRKVNPMFIKTFSHVPMADLELLFPEVRTTLRPIDLIKTTITVCLGITSAISNLDSDESLLGSVTFLTFLVLAFKTAVDWYFSVYYYEDLTIRFLYNKGMDNHGGVIVKLMKEVKNQEYKESLLGYFFLLQKGECTIQELKQECDHFLAGLDKYQTSVEKIDFEIDDSVNKLKQLGLLIQKDAFLQAVPLSEAINRLEEIWKKSFQEPNPSFVIDDLEH